MDLQKLAELPYYGQAKKELIKAGKRDEDKGKPMKRYAVAYTLQTVIEARSEEEAEGKIRFSFPGSDIDMIQEVS